MRDTANSESEKSKIDVVLEALNQLDTETTTQRKLLSR